MRGLSALRPKITAPTGWRTPKTLFSMCYALNGASAVVKSANATIVLAGKDLFLGVTPSGHAVAMDTDHERSTAPSPVELLLVALGACAGVDVVSILEKKRMTVSAYRIEVSGQRRDEHPRAYTKMNVRHIVTGRNISPRAVEQAIELSQSKYCSVAATLRPTVEIHSSFEIIEEPNE